MKVVSILCGILLTTSSFASVSFNEVQLIYNRIITANHLRYIPLKLSSSKVPNAYTDWTKVVITKGMLKALENEDEAALVLGHESGHANHIPYTLHNHSRKASYKEEEYADTMGGKYMTNAGYSLRNACKIFKHWNDPADSTHPSSYERYKHLGC